MSNLELLEDACADLPHTTRRMFGGAGLFAPNGGMFAGLVDDDRLMLKFAIGTPDHDAFLAIGGAPWVYGGGQKEMVMREWLVLPDELYDDPRGLAAWARRAHNNAPPKKAKKGAGPKKASAKKTGMAKPAAKKAAKRPAAKKAPAKKRR